MSDIASLREKLTIFGLTPAEGDLYLHLVNREPLTVVQIASALNVPRTSVYDHLESLVSKGLVERIVRYKSQSFRAYPLDILDETIARQRERLQAMTDSLTFLKTNVPLLSEAGRIPSTQVRYYHGASGFRQMMMHSLAAEGEMIGYSEFGRASVVGQAFTDEWKRTMRERGIRDRVITTDMPAIIAYLSRDSERDTRNGFQLTRIIPRDILHISGDTTIYNGVFAVSWWNTGEVVGVEIENAELVRTQKSIFEILWNTAQPLP